MPHLAELSELIGFFSYSRDDDADSSGALSALRERIQRELRGQLGRSTKNFRLWQDKEAIAPGKLWEQEIMTAVAQAVFFIPIITPTTANSPYCRFEFDAFLKRERELGRNDLVFPLLYIRVPGLEDEVARAADPLLSMIAERQYVDWREFRHRDVQSSQIGEAVERLCSKIVEALSRPYDTDASSVVRGAAQKVGPPDISGQIDERLQAARHHHQDPKDVPIGGGVRQPADDARLVQTTQKLAEKASATGGSAVLRQTRAPLAAVSLAGIAVALFSLFGGAYYNWVVRQDSGAPGIQTTQAGQQRQADAPGLIAKNTEPPTKLVSQAAEAPQIADSAQVPTGLSPTCAASANDILSEDRTVRLQAQVDLMSKCTDPASISFVIDNALRQTSNRASIYDILSYLDKIQPIDVRTPLLRQKIHDFAVRMASNSADSAAISARLKTRY